MTKDEALDLALEALEESHPEAYRHVITAIKQARSAPLQSAERGEPVAWRWTNGKGWLTYGEIPHDRFESTPLYTTPPAQPAPVQEPVATVKVLPLGDGHKPMYWADWADADNPPPENTLLYTTPPAAQRQWARLTDEEIYEIGFNTNIGGVQILKAYKAIEAKIKEKA